MSLESFDQLVKFHIWFVWDVCLNNRINILNKNITSVTTDSLGYISNQEKNMRLPGNGNYL